MRERLGEHRSGDDHVARGGIWPDCPVAASTREDLLEQASDLGAKRDDLPVMDDSDTIDLCINNAIMDNEVLKPYAQTEGERRSS